MMQSSNKQAEWREVYKDDMGHFKSLKKGVFLCIFVFIASFILSFYYSKNILDFILSDGKEIGYEFVYLTPIEIIAEQIKLSCVMAFVITLPIILVSLTLFIMPAIDGSMFAIAKTLIFAGLLFVTGTAFSYFVLMPFSFRMFYEIGIETQITAQISVQKYVDLYITLTIVLGLIFEMPLIAAFMSYIGIIKSKIMTRGRFLAIIIIMIISNIITPTTDLFTAILVDVPMYGLYELSILICKQIEKKKMMKLAEA